MEREQLYFYTDKIVECFEHKDQFKQVQELQKVIKEIWEDSRKSTNKKEIESNGQ